MPISRRALRLSVIVAIFVTYGLTELLGRTGLSTSLAAGSATLLVGLTLALASRVQTGSNVASVPGVIGLLMLIASVLFLTNGVSESSDINGFVAFAGATAAVAALVLLVTKVVDAAVPRRERAAPTTQGVPPATPEHDAGPR